MTQHSERRAARRPDYTESEPSGLIHIEQQSLLDSLDLSKRLEKKTYNEQLAYYQGKLNKLARQAHEQKISSILVSFHAQQIAR